MCDCRPKYRNEFEKDKDTVWVNSMARNQFFLFLEKESYNENNYYSTDSRKIRCCGIKKLKYYTDSTDVRRCTNYTGCYWWKIPFNANNETKYYGEHTWHLDITFVQPEDIAFYQQVINVFQRLDTIRYHEYLIKDMKKYYGKHYSNDSISEQLSRRVEQDKRMVRDDVFDILNVVDDNPTHTTIWNQFVQDSKDTQNIIKKITEDSLEEIKHLDVEELKRHMALKISTQSV